MRVYNVSSDPAIGAQDIRIIGDQVAIVFDPKETETFMDLLNAANPATDWEIQLQVNLLSKLRTMFRRGF